MSRKRDYTDFIKFVLENPEFTRTQMLTEFRKSGGKIQKQKGLEIQRQLLDIKKGDTSTRGISTKEIKKRKGSSFITFKEDDKQGLYRSSGIVNTMFENIQKLYGYSDNETKFLKVNLQIGSYIYTIDNKFGVFIPYFNESGKYGIKKLGGEILKSLHSYYTHLMQLYGEKETMVNSILEMVDNLKNYWDNDIKYPSLTDLLTVFSMYNIKVDSINYIEFI